MKVVGLTTCKVAGNMESVFARFKRHMRSSYDDESNHPEGGNTCHTTLS